MIIVLYSVYAIMIFKKKNKSPTYQYIAAIDNLQVSIPIITLLPSHIGYSIKGAELSAQVTTLTS